MRHQRTVLWKSFMKFVMVKSFLCMDLEDGEIDTVGGLILNLLEAPAEEGDTVGYRGLEFKVTRTENGGVERCTVTRITPLMREEVLEEEE